MNRLAHHRIKISTLQTLRLKLRTKKKKK
ncbi:hypothetical protein TSAR_016645 [Trichomalopsis sarcophagae]|uniref:Uncharacterized protein n=1 Tax=Trichomalopsis sarcophagae TaxID=543379 RepID=A0A232EGU0_9HYME|nr:hypothetical protein TSAR_016645 [Trichomalopsis sarcophagae]